MYDRDDRCMLVDKYRLKTLKVLILSFYINTSVYERIAYLLYPYILRCKSSISPVPLNQSL